MIKHLVLLTFICLFFACRSQEDKNSFASLIKGDWVGLEQSRAPWESQTKNFASFEDSTYQNGLMQDSFKYEVKADTLYLKGIDWEGHNFLSKFSIVKLTFDSLVLLSGRKQEYTSRFSKVRAKNNITPAVIYFSSSGCFGRCPIMDLEIDSLWNFRFYGQRYTSITGGFRGRLSENDYNSIVRKIRNIPIDSLQDFYEESATDQETLGVSIVHGNKVIRSSAYGHDKEPIELHILFGKLINLYAHVPMQPDSSVNLNYFSSKRNVLPVLIPPIQMQKFTPPKLVED